MGLELGHHPFHPRHGRGDTLGEMGVLPVGIPFRVRDDAAALVVQKQLAEDGVRVGKRHSLI